MAIEKSNNAWIANGNLKRLGDSQWASGEGVALGNYSFVEIGNDLIRKVIIPHELDGLLNESLGKDIKIFMTPKNEVAGVVLEDGSAYYYSPTKNPYAQALFWIPLVVYLPIIIMLGSGEGGLIFTGILLAFFLGVPVGIFGLAPLLGKAIVTGNWKGRHERAGWSIKKEHPEAKRI